jgi:aminopeptidase N
MPDFSIVSNRTAEKEDVTSGITYQKGAWVIHMLRDLMGEKNFKKGIQNYYTKYFNANTTTDEFRTEMEKVSGKDLKLFFKQWLYQPVNPTINASWTYNASTKKLTVQLHQAQKYLYNVPVEIGYYKKGASTPTILTMNLKQKDQVYSFPLTSSPEKLELDPRNVLLNDGKMSKE